MAEHLVHEHETDEEWDSELQERITRTKYYFDDTTGEVIKKGEEYYANARRYNNPSWKELTPVRMSREKAPPEVAEKLKTLGF